MRFVIGEEALSSTSLFNPHYTVALSKPAATSQHIPSPIALNRLGIGQGTAEGVLFPADSLRQPCSHERLCSLPKALSPRAVFGGHSGKVLGIESRDVIRPGRSHYSDIGT